MYRCSHDTFEHACVCWYSQTPRPWICGFMEAAKLKPGMKNARKWDSSGNVTRKRDASGRIRVLLGPNSFPPLSLFSSSRNLP